jgi:hypothetical protein
MLGLPAWVEVSVKMLVLKTAGFDAEGKSFDAEAQRRRENAETFLSCSSSFLCASLSLCASASRFVVFLLLVLALAGCGGESTPTPTPVTVTVETGGMAVTALPATDAPVSAETPAPSPTPAPPLAAGAPVEALAALRIYADADPAAPVLAEYAAGAAFVVLDPGGDYGAYPVEVDGVPWYRVRAEDGLVGWVRGDQVQAPS